MMNMHSLQTLTFAEAPNQFPLVRCRPRTDRSAMHCDMHGKKYFTISQMTQKAAVLPKYQQGQSVARQT